MKLTDEEIRELKELRAMQVRLKEWAIQLDETVGESNVGKFIAAELRNRMAGR